MKIISHGLVSSQAVKYIEYDSSFSEEEKKQAKALKVACNLNDAACKLKLKEYRQAEKLCTKVQTKWWFRLTYPFFLITSEPIIMENDLLWIYVLGARAGKHQCEGPIQESAGLHGVG